LTSIVSPITAILQDLGQPEQALPLAEHALAVIEAAYGPKHPNVADILDTLVQILRGLGELRTAAALAERALTITQAAYGPNHGSIAARRDALTLLGHEPG